MIAGIGTDIVAIERMAQALERHGERFAQRILSEAEFKAFHQAPNQAGFLAKKFAAKEAAAKALGTGFRDGITLPQISVSHDALGKPLLQLSGRAQEVAESLGIVDSHVSISDENKYAVAFVVLTRS